MRKPQTTVGELIALLSRYPDSKPVAIYCEAVGEYLDISLVDAEPSQVVIETER